MTNEYECRYVCYTCIPVLRNIPIDLLHAHIIWKNQNQMSLLAMRLIKFFYVFAINKTLFQTFRITDVDSSLRHDSVNATRRLLLYSTKACHELTVSAKSVCRLGRSCWFCQLGFCQFCQFCTRDSRNLDDFEMIQWFRNHWKLVTTFSTPPKKVYTQPLGIGWISKANSGKRVCLWPTMRSAKKL